MKTATLDNIQQEVQTLRRMVAKVMNGATLDKKWLSSEVFAKEVGAVTNADGSPLTKEQLRYMRNNCEGLYNDRTRKYNIEKYNEILNQC